jgi:hypothetical protein
MTEEASEHYLGELMWLANMTRPDLAYTGLH